MKKITLLTTAFIFSISLMAQNETKNKPTKPAPSKVARVETKPEATVPVAAAATDAKVAEVSQVSPDNIIKVNTVEHNFGKIKQGVPVTYYFELKNISDKPVVVENTYASCGCTTPDKIVEPILPGATAKLKVQFNAAAVGPINKDVHIKFAGIAQEKLVKITGEVVAAEAPKSGN